MFLLITAKICNDIAFVVRLKLQAWLIWISSDNVVCFTIFHGTTSILSFYHCLSYYSEQKIVSLKFLREKKGNNYLAHIQQAMDVESILETLGMRQEYNPGCPLLCNTVRTHIHNQGPFILVCPHTGLFLGDGRKPENSEETHEEHGQRWEPELAIKPGTLQLPAIITLCHPKMDLY